MKAKKISRILLMVAPLLMVLAVYGRLPEQVPMQWGMDGVSRYGAKWELFLMAGINLLLGILMPQLAKIDPKRKNYARFEKVYEWFMIWILGFITILMALTLSEALHPDMVNIPKAVCSMVALLFLFIGNMMPKVKQNYFTGIKTPWALSSEAVWNKTQRLGGKAFFFGGILLLVSAFFATEKALMPLILGVVAVVCVVPVGMSYIWYQKEQNEIKGESHEKL